MNEKPVNTRDVIYLDHNATTPTAPAVSKAMMPFMGREFGNPSSAYNLGKRAKESLEKAREEVARLLGCSKEVIVFTSGGSEANNTVLKGIIDFKRPRDFTFSWFASSEMDSTLASVYLYRRPFFNRKNVLTGKPFFAIVRM